ncbi:hypothetical protein EVAR_7418_1 [Eumeta japonica]|uniref:Uncharacterized protein n=1 Tax=Eumeta variegata TaxID=151549 RepID=A0A4C1V7D3_EUMVA|nr:hypothetical protein EVAR_7418_1 [Eumeta japonica]
MPICLTLESIAVPLFIPHPVSVQIASDFAPVVDPGPSLNSAIGAAPHCDFKFKRARVDPPHGPTPTVTSSDRSRH